jgi:hypothetical protein
MTGDNIVAAVCVSSGSGRTKGHSATLAQPALLSRDHEVSDFTGSDQERKTADSDAYERGVSPLPPGSRADREEAERQSKESGYRTANQPEGQGDRAETPEPNDD